MAAASISSSISSSITLDADDDFLPAQIPQPPTVPDEEWDKIAPWNAPGSSLEPEPEPEPEPVRLHLTGSAKYCLGHSFRCSVSSVRVAAPLQYDRKDAPPTRRWAVGDIEAVLHSADQLHRPIHSRSVEAGVSFYTGQRRLFCWPADKNCEIRAAVNVGFAAAPFVLKRNSWGFCSAVLPPY